MTVISTPNASLKQPVPIDPISNITSMPVKRQSLSESYRVRSMADLRLTLRHGDPTHRYLRGILAWRRGLLDGLRHGDLAHRYLRAILAWRRGSSFRPSARRPCLQVPQRHPVVAKGVLFPPFGTATLPTDAPGASSRGKGGFWTVFGTATPHIGAPEASSRGEGGPLSAL